jgi:ArsR family transcriptional regulator
MKSILSPCKALSDGNRLRVFSVLLQDRELCACEITELLGVTGATVSRHMHLLEEAGLVTSRKSGRWVHYRTAPDLSPALRAWLTESLQDSEFLAEDLKRLSAPLSCSPPPSERPTPLSAQDLHHV